MIIERRRRISTKPLTIVLTINHQKSTPILTRKIESKPKPVSFHFIFLFLFLFSISTSIPWVNRWLMPLQLRFTVVICAEVQSSARSYSFKLFLPTGFLTNQRTSIYLSVRSRDEHNNNFTSPATTASLLLSSFLPQSPTFSTLARIHTYINIENCFRFPLRQSSSSSSSSLSPTVSPWRQRRSLSPVGPGRKLGKAPRFFLPYSRNSGPVVGSRRKVAAQSKICQIALGRQRRKSVPAGISVVVAPGQTSNVAARTIQIDPLGIHRLIDLVVH